MLGRSYPECRTQAKKELILTKEKSLRLFHYTCIVTYESSVRSFTLKVIYSFIACLFIISCYYINTNEIPGELSRENLISSHVKITCYLHM